MDDRFRGVCLEIASSRLDRRQSRFLVFTFHALAQRAPPPPPLLPRFINQLSAFPAVHSCLKYASLPAARRILYFAHPAAKG